MALAYAAYGQWYTDAPTMRDVALFFGLVNLLAAIFLVVPFLAFEYRRDDNLPVDVETWLGSPLCALALGYFLVAGHWSPASVALVPLAYCAVFAGLATLLARRGRQATNRFVVLVACAAVTLALVPPILWSFHWLTMAWALLSLAVTRIGLRLPTAAFSRRAWSACPLSWPNSSCGITPRPCTGRPGRLRPQRRTPALRGAASRHAAGPGCHAAPLGEPGPGRARREDRLAGDDPDPAPARLADPDQRMPALFPGVFPRRHPRRHLGALDRLRSGAAGDRISDQPPGRAPGCPGPARTHLLKVFLVDTADFATPYRILVLLLLGLSCIGLSFLYHKFKSRVLDDTGTDR